MFLSIAYVSSCKMVSHYLKVGDTSGDMHCDSIRKLWIEVGTFSEVCYARYKSVTYGFHTDKNDIIDYLYTSDSKFKVDGLTVNSTYGDIKRKFPDIKLLRVPGYSCYVALPSGWNAFLMLPETRNAKVGDGERIKYFFQ